MEAQTRFKAHADLQAAAVVVIQQNQGSPNSWCWPYSRCATRDTEQSQDSDLVW